MNNMAKHVSDLTICFIILVTVSFLIIINKTISSSKVFQDVDVEYSWIVHGIVNIIGYSTILIPGYVIYKYVKKVNYLDRIDNGCLSRTIRRCFDESELTERNISASTTAPQRTALQDAMLLLFYFSGLQVSFLSWGVLQEKVMTQEYINSDKEIGHFKDSQFLVFVNRILAFCMSGIVILCRREPRHRCPLYKYVFCSLSNILSSWCQYEALKYVSFLHQVLAKAGKMIPVMIMGKIVSRAKYERYEYFTAIVLSSGMLFFMLDTGNVKGSTITTLSGAFLLCAYIAFDSFTSNWQGALFKQYSMSPVQMMCAVNLFSCMFTAVSLLQQGSFVTSLNFMTQFPSFIIDCILLSVCSAGGQLFIYSTLAAFGPVVFAIISTIRQGFSVLLSCIIYKHHVNAMGIFGIILVFLSILFRIYCGHRKRKHAQSANVTKVMK